MSTELMETYRDAVSMALRPHGPPEVLARDREKLCTYEVNA